MIIVGLMSGTSLDGVDAVACEINKVRGRIEINPLATAFLSYPGRLKERLLRVSGENGSTGEVCELDGVIGEFFAKAVNKLLRSQSMQEKRIDLIGSHGQTIHHLPRKKRTLQIGDPAIIAERTGACVWSDFRSADMAKGGEGAPLAPVIHLPLFGDKKKNVAVVNIGGIANITSIPAGAETLDGIVAYDTGPGNMLIDHAVGAMGKGAYDRGGEIASSGKVDDSLLKEFLSHPYFRKRPPKSTGREVFGARFRLDSQGYKYNADTVATLTELTAVTIVKEANRLFKDRNEGGRVVICGGGSKNRYLLNRIDDLTGPAIEVITSDNAGFPAQAVEGALMALLAYYSEKGERLNLLSVTGSKAPVALGSRTGF